jgi:hypothetical protein
MTILPVMQITLSTIVVDIYASYKDDSAATRTALPAKKTIAATGLRAIRTTLPARRMILPTTETAMMKGF